MLDLLVRHANLPDGRREMDIACQDGRIVEVAAGIDAPRATLEIDADRGARSPLRIATDS